MQYAINIDIIGTIVQFIDAILYIIDCGSLGIMNAPFKIFNPVEEHLVQNMCTVHHIILHVGYNVGGSFCKINLNLILFCHQKFPM